MTSQFADGLLQAALITAVVFSPTEQSTTAGFAKAMAMIYVPYSIVGPFVGTLIDRWSRKAILVWAPVVRAAFALPLLAMGTQVPWWGMASALVVFSGNRFFLATAAAVVPRLVSTEDLVTANSVSIVGGTFAAFLGTFIGALVATATGANTLIVTTAVLLVVASLIASQLRRNLTAHRGTRTPLRHGMSAAWKEFADGAGRLARTPRASWPIGSIVLDQFVQYSVIILSLFVLKDSFGKGVGSYSWLLGAGALGIILGIASVKRLSARLTKERLVALGFAMAGTALIINATFLVPGVTFITAGLLGLTFAWRKITVDTMVQEAVPDSYRGRVFSVYDVLFNMARVAAGYAAWLALGPIGAAGALLFCGAVSLAWSPVLPWAIRRVPEFGLRVDEHDNPVEVIRGGPAESVAAIPRDDTTQRDGQSIRTVQLMLDDGSSIDVERTDSGAWLLLDER